MHKRTLFVKSGKEIAGGKRNEAVNISFNLYD